VSPSSGACSLRQCWDPAAAHNCTHAFLLEIDPAFTIDSCKVEDRGRRKQAVSLNGRPRTVAGHVERRWVEFQELVVIHGPTSHSTASASGPAWLKQNRMESLLRCASRSSFLLSASSARVTSPSSPNTMSTRKSNLLCPGGKPNDVDLRLRGGRGTGKCAQVAPIAPDGHGGGACRRWLYSRRRHCWCGDDRGNDRCEPDNDPSTAAAPTTTAENGEEPLVLVAFGDSVVSYPGPEAEVIGAYADM
jgi:hypothetical protein